MQKKGAKYGSKTPYLRSKKLSTDRASSEDVILNILNWFKKIKILILLFYWSQHHL